MSALDDLGRFIETGSMDKSGPRRIYISRRDARLRRVSNEARLLPVLESHGFRSLTLSGLPVARQVQLFRQAEAVAAPHGAGLAHIAWCKPGTKIIEIFPSPDGPLGRVKNASADMWLIAMQRALAHRCYLAGPLETRSDAFSIPLQLLLEALHAAGLTSS